MEQAQNEKAERKKQFFQRIKTETADLHKQTESAPLSVALVSEAVNEKVYTDYLLRMKDIVAWYEEVVFNGLSRMIPDIEQRRKLQFLKNDLTQFNIDPEKDARHFSLPDAETNSVLLGYMYVFEGSSLGGAMIYKHVSRHIDITEQKGGSFFTCYQSDLSARWKSFLDIMGEQSLTGKNADEIITGGKRAFEGIYKHLSYNPE